MAAPGMVEARKQLRCVNGSNRALRYSWTVPGPDEVRQVLSDLDIPARLRPDLRLEVGDQILLVEVKNRVTGSDVGGVVTQMRKDAKAAKADGVLLVADRISIPARDVLSSSGIGWSDRRGHIRLRGRGLLIDSTSRR